MPIINTFDQLIAARGVGLPDVAINPAYWQGTHKTYRNGWEIYRPGKIVRGAQNQDNYYGKSYGCLVFEDDNHDHKKGRRDALAKAMTVAGVRYGIVEWKRNRMGAYVDHRMNTKFPLEK